MDVRPLERDQAKAVRWESDFPPYRVDFWRQLAPPPGGDPAKMGFKRDSYYLTDAESVEDVLQWAADNREDRTFVVWAMAKHAGEAGILRLRGDDPTNPKRDANRPSGSIAP